MKKTISLVLVLALGLVTGVVKADFTFGTPTNLGPIVNSHSAEQSPSISTDGLTLFFDSNRFNEYYIHDIWVTTRKTTSDPWEPPVTLVPIVNSSFSDGTANISADGLALYFASERPGEYGEVDIVDIWITTRATTEDEWMIPVNLGRTVNITANDFAPSISANSLELFFASDRTGGFSEFDIWVTMRKTIQDPWREPANLGPIVNTSAIDITPSISADGLELFFTSDRPGGFGVFDIWVTGRPTVSEPWGQPVNLGPIVNTSAHEYCPNISADGFTLFFHSDRPGGFGDFDIWQAPIIPIVDFNGDGIVDCVDMCIMVDHWGTDYQLCDIGPMPWGDGIVDVQDLIVLAEHLFEGIPPVEPEEVNVDESDDGSQVELEQGQILVVTLKSNPTTGYRWEVAEIQESILEQMGEAEFKPSETGEPPLVGAGGWEIFRFKAISAGQMTLQLVYRRPWEEGVEPINTFSIEVVVN